MSTSAAAVLSAAGAGAHHSTSMYQLDKVITIQGTIKEFQYTQPHAWIQVMAPDSTGKMVEWSMETGSPTVLMRAGVRKSSLPVGEKVTISFHPVKTGQNGGLFITATTAHGKTVSFKTSKGNLVEGK
jgi:hypothetical protein